MELNREHHDNQEDTCEIIRTKIAECESVIALETKKLNNLRHTLNCKLREDKKKVNGTCDHVWIYRRTHLQGWRYCQKCRIYEDIEL